MGSLVGWFLVWMNLEEALEYIFPKLPPCLAVVASGFILLLIQASPAVGVMNHSLLFPFQALGCWSFPDSPGASPSRIGFLSLFTPLEIVPSLIYLQSSPLSIVFDSCPAPD